MIKKTIFIIMALLLIILFVNRVHPEKSIEQNFNIVMGCEDFEYNFYTNVPTEIDFSVTKSNGIDPVGPFKTIYVYQNDSTVLHCGNDYHVTYSAAGFKTYEDDIIVNGFKPILEGVKVINLDKI